MFSIFCIFTIKKQMHNKVICQKNYLFSFKQIGTYNLLLLIVMPRLIIFLLLILQNVSVLSVLSSTMLYFTKPVPSVYDSSDAEISVSDFPSSYK